MFYLTKRTRVADCKIGDRVMVLSDFPGIEAGSKGIVDEIYGDETGIYIRLDATGHHAGFTEELLALMAFGTYAHPTDADAAMPRVAPPNLVDMSAYRPNKEDA